MSDFLGGILKSLVVLLPFFLLSYANHRANLKREERCKQLWMTPVAVVLCIVALGRLSWFYDLALELINWLIDLVDRLGRWLSRSSIGQDLLDLSHWLRSRNLPYWAFYVTNALILLVYILVKKFCLIFQRRFFRDGSAFQMLAGAFYAYDETTGRWHLIPKFSQARTFLNTMYISAALIGGCLLIASGRLYLEGTLKVPFYPVFWMILLGEPVFFLNGLTRKEYLRNIRGEADQSERVSNYAVLRRILRQLFPDKLSAEDTTVSESAQQMHTTDEVLSALEESDAVALEAYGHFMRKKADGGLTLDRNYLMSGKQLLQGESVLFNDPFYYDLIPYVSFPMNRTLLRHKKVLIILGRHGAQESARRWCARGLTDVNGISSMWNIGVLTQQPQELDVGIVTRSSVHDLELHEANRAFFDDVEFVMLLEPSRLITTAQVGLNSIVRHCRRREKQLVFCSTDKNCDGLVDALSHILMTSLREVSATGHHRGASSYMIWDADGEYLQHRLTPNLSRYLGMGTEMSFVALKNQVGTAWWYGGDAFPVVDTHWIARQYYYELLRYAELPATQETLEEVFRISANMWEAETEERKYITVEDESYNMFEIKRVFSTRATDQGFINVICSDYLLKDYMADNDSIFSADPKAIPYITADYARTARNVVLRLCLRLSTGLVPQREIRREMLLIDQDGDDPIGSFWRTLCATCSHLGAARVGFDGVLRIHCAGEDGIFSSDVVLRKRRFDMDTGRMETMYTITDSRFIRLVLEPLCPAEYIAEDESGQRQYLGSELRGHIFQKYLPGQFFTLGGKYYEMLRVTADGKVLVRRASEHIDGRPSYRQVREYFISKPVDSTVMGECRDMGPLRLTRQAADIRVETPAYWDMKRYNDFSTARKVCINGIPTRFYNNKTILRIDLNQDGVDGKTVATLVLMMNEVLRTLLAENQDYLAVVSGGSAREPNTYSLLPQGEFVPKPESIYIIEDSQMDIGLLDAVERNLNRIFAIVCDYLHWHEEMMEASLNPPPPPAEPEIPKPQTSAETQKGGKKGRGIFPKIFRKKASAPEPEPELEQEPEPEPKLEPEEAVPSSETETAESRMFFDAEVSAPENAPEQTDAGNDADISYEPEQTHSPEGPAFARKPYHQRYYLGYGRADLADSLAIAGVRELLDALSYGNNALTQARHGKNVAEMVERTFRPGQAGSHYCDFCGNLLTGLDYEILADGRDRCAACGRTAVKSEEDFIALYDAAIRNMKIFFGVSINAPVKVEMVNSKRLHRRLGKTFVPTDNADGRVLGVAIKDRGGYTILVENGAPRLRATMTMVHELTHIWQYLNWKADGILNTYGPQANLAIYEGMAKWVELQYAYLLGETADAKREEIITRNRSDEYGQGFRLYAQKYPLSIRGGQCGVTPFDDPAKPL